MGEAEENLEIVGHQDNFNNWMFDAIKPYVGGDVLEVGSGIGTISKRIISKVGGNKIYLTDISYKYISRLKKRFSGKNVKVSKLDLGRKKDFQQFKNESIDTIVCLNVLEHVKDDIFALENMKKLLRKGGRIILLVPAHKALYNELDRAVLHYRRYSKKDINYLRKKSGLSMKKLFYFNFISILGWFINGTVFKKKKVNDAAFGFLNMFVPLFKFIENNILFRSIGLSLIVVFEK